MLFRDFQAPLEDRIEDLLGRLTMEEKAGLMKHEADGVPRLGIPEYNWWNEALHGVARASRATVFPQAIGMAATFDDDLMEKVASAIAEEGRAIHHEAARKGQRGQHFGLTYWSPNVNIFRDPRWGRGQETYGEDPILTARMGTAFVKGLQGDHPKYLKAAACAKHYAVHSGPEKLRHTFDSKVSDYDLWDTYLPAFQALVEAGVESVMGAYNRVGGRQFMSRRFFFGCVFFFFGSLRIAPGLGQRSGGCARRATWISTCPSGWWTTPASVWADWRRPGVGVSPPGCWPSPVAMARPPARRWSLQSSPRSGPCGLPRVI